MYLFDANVFIAAYTNYYSFSIAPNFWNWLEKQIKGGIVSTIPKVVEEITAIDSYTKNGRKCRNDLARWINRIPSAYWADFDDASISSGSVIIDWIKNNRSYYDSAKAEYEKSADSYLIAKAHSGQHTVVTHEKSSPYSKRTIKIPDICTQFHINCKDPFEVFTTLNLRL